MKRLVAAAAIAALLAACGSDAPTGGDAEPVATDRVEAGTTVTWTNNDNFVHDVHLLDGPGTTEALPVGGSASITFNDVGRVRYECSLHPQQMSGSIQVT